MSFVVSVPWMADREKLEAGVGFVVSENLSGAEIYRVFSDPGNVAFKVQWVENGIEPTEK